MENIRKKRTLKENVYESQNIYENIEGEAINKGFVQYYRISLPYRSQLLEENPTAYRVFDLLASCMEDNNTIATSKEEIAETIGKSKETVKRAIKLLKEYNFLCIIRFGKDYIYFLNPVIVFNRTADYKSTTTINYCNNSQYGDTKIMMDLKTNNSLNNFKSRERVSYKFKAKHGEFNEDTATATAKYIERMRAFEKSEQIIDNSSPNIEKMENGFEYETDL